MLTIHGGSNLTKTVTSLDKYTEYEFRLLAFTSVGDGPKGSLHVQRTEEDGNTFNLCLYHLYILNEFV